MLSPAEPMEIMGLLTKLRLNKPFEKLAEEELSVLLEDYLEDLGEFPADLIAEACRQYRRSNHPDHKFFPRVCQLREITVALFCERKAVLRKLEVLRQRAEKSTAKLIDEGARNRLGEMFAELSKELERG